MKLLSLRVGRTTLSRIIRGGGFNYQSANFNNANTDIPMASVVRITEDGQIIREAVEDEVIDDSVVPDNVVRITEDGQIIRNNTNDSDSSTRKPLSPDVVQITEDGEVIRYVEEEIEEDDEFIETVFDENGEPVETHSTDEGEFEETVLPNKTPQEEAEEEAERIIADATRKAKGLVAQAKMEVKTLKIKAREDAYNEGFSSAIAKIEDVIINFDANLQHIQQAQEDFVTDFENTVISFSIEIANEIMRREIEVDPFALCDMVEHSMHSIREAKWAVISLSKKLQPLIDLLRSELAAKHKNIESIDVVGIDIDITECSVDTPNGRIELSIITQLDNLVKRFEMIDRQQ